MLYTLVTSLYLAAVAHGKVDRGICGPVTDKTTILPHLRCNFEGYLKNGKPFTSFETSYEKCRDFCLVGARCKAFSFIPTDGQPVQSSNTGACTIYRARIYKQNSRKGDTGVYFWNRNCFNVQFYDFAPVMNGDFQLGTLEHWTSDDTNTIHEEQLQDQSIDYSVDVTASCLDGEDCDNAVARRIFQYVFLCAGVRYALTYDITQPVNSTVIPSSRPDRAMLGGVSLGSRSTSQETQITSIAFNAAQMTITGPNNQPYGVFPAGQTAQPPPYLITPQTSGDYLLISRVQAYQLGRVVMRFDNAKIEVV